MEILRQILVCIGGLAILYYMDYAKTKKPFDDNRKNFLFKRDFWKWRKDNVILKMITGAVAGYVSSEWGQDLMIYIIKRIYTDLPEFAENSLGLTTILFFTILCGEVVNRYVMGKRISEKFD